MIACARIVITCAAALWLCGSAPAHGQQGGGVRAEAERFFRAGEQAYNTGQYLVAAQAFEQAYELLPLPAIAFSTAQAYRLQYFVDKEPSRLKRAIELYRGYVEAVSEGGRREDAITSLAELEPILLRIESASGTVSAEKVASSTTQLMVSSQVDGARATIDDGSGTVPYIREVAPGPHTIRVEADGYFPVEQQATAVEGKFIVIEVTLRPKPARVIVTSEPGGEVAIDGRPVGVTPLDGAVEVAAGQHFVTVTRRGRQAWSQEIVVERGEELQLRAPLRVTGQRRASLWVAGVAGAAYAAAGVSAVLAWRAGSDAADLEDLRQRQGLTLAELGDYQAARDRRDDRLQLTYALVGAGTAAALAGAALYFFDTPRAEASSPAVTVAPVLAGDGPGMAVSGRF